MKELEQLEDDIREALDCLHAYSGETLSPALRLASDPAVKERIEAAVNRSRVRAGFPSVHEPQHRG